MKILSLFVALLLIASFVPATAAIAQEEGTNVVEDCVARMAKQYPDVAEERLEEKCKNLRTVATKVTADKDVAVQAKKIAAMTATQKRLQLQLEKLGEDKEKILESLTEEQREKLASLDRARIYEYAKKNSADIKKALDHITITKVKKEEAFKKRVVAQNKVDKAKENYERARNKYDEAKEDYTQARELWEKAVKAKNDDDAIKHGKVYLVGAAEMVIASLEKVQSQIESNDDLTEEEATEALTEIKAKIAEMEEAKEQVMNAETKEEVKEASKTISQAWTRTRVRLAVHAEKQVQTSVGEILSRSTALENHLERILADMEEDGVDTSEIDDKVEEFSEKIADAREKFAESKEKFEEAKETNDRELLQESKELSREAHQLLGEAQKILRDIAQEVKAQGYDIEDNNEYVEIIEEDDDADETETEEEDEEEVEEEEETESEEEEETNSCDEEIELEVEEENGKVYLTWTEMDCDDFQGYKVVRSQDVEWPKYPEDGYLSYITDASETTYTEEALAGTSYYAITVLTESGKVYSEPVEMTYEGETDEPVACCMAMTADCLACSAGKSVEDYCEKYSETIGCENLIESEDNETEEGDEE